MSGPLESIARYLVSLPDEAVEGLLATYDALVGVSAPEQRPVAADLLRRNAASAQDPARRDRLLRAADAVAAGQPSGHPPPSAATNVEWVVAAPPASVVEESEEDDSPYLEEEPPPLPHLPVRHFFNSLVFRVGRDFVDAGGRAVRSGELLNLLRVAPSEEGFDLTFPDRNICLGDPAIIENADNAWFQPMPTDGGMP